MTAAERFWARVESSVGDGCRAWRGARSRDGYGRFVHDGETYAHRHAWRFTFGPIPAGAHVLHGCDNPGCVRPSHLRLGTPADNGRDKAERGRAWAPRVKFPAVPAEIKRVIVEEHARGVSQASLARRYGIHQTTANRIVLRARRAEEVSRA